MYPYKPNPKQIEQDKTKIGQTFDEEIPIIEEDEIDYDPEDLLET